MVEPEQALVLASVPGPEPLGAADEARVRALSWSGAIGLAQLLRYTAPAYGHDTWAGALSAVHGWPSEWAIVDALAGELRARLTVDPDAVFDEPVRVKFTDPEEWSNEDQLEYGDRPVLPHVANGMHRIAAAVVAGAPKILVASGDGEDSQAFDGQLVELRYRLTGTSTAGVPDPNADIIDFAFSWLRSFRLTDHVWVEAATVGSCGAEMRSLYHCPHERRGDLVEALVARSAGHGVTFDLVGARDVTWQLLETEDEAS